jgi:hypothetical protein
MLGLMRFRKLRIAFSVTCIVACVLLIALWVRSYWCWDDVAWRLTTKRGFLVSSQSGGAVLDYHEFDSSALALIKWRVRSQPSPDKNLLPIAGIDEAYAGFLLLNGPDGFLLVIPYWFLVPLTLALAATPWLPMWSRRFTLRTLLIATTLVAVVLGLIVAVF